MVIIQLPAAGWIPEQVKRVVEILEENMPVLTFPLSHNLSFKKGIQILCPKDLIDISSSVDSLSPSFPPLSLSRKNFLASVKQIPNEYVNTFHGPISPHNKDPQLNLLCSESVKYYTSLAEFIQQVGGEVLVIHCNSVFDPEEWSGSLTDYKYVQEKVFDVIITHLKEIASQVKIKIAVENLPFPLKGNVTSELNEIPFDPSLITVQQIQNFLQQLPPNIGLAFDTSHYGISQEKINYLWRKYGVPTLENINREGLKGIYPEMIKEQLSIVEAFKKIQEFSHKIFHIQLADYRGTWFPNKDGFKPQQFYEGYPVGRGDLGKDLFDLCSVVSEKYTHIPISLDLDVTDYMQRPEQIRALKEVINHLLQFHDISMIEDKINIIRRDKNMTNQTTNAIIRIGNKEIKNFGEPFIIAEIGSNHNGNLDLAKQLIDKAVECGADAVKFQSFDTTLFSEACYENDSRRQQLMAESPALKNFFTVVHPDLKRQMQEYMTSKEMMKQIKEYCDTKGVIFFCTPLDKNAVDFCVDELNMPIIKIASMDVNNLPFLDYIARKGKPLFLSTGMSSFSEIIEAVETITRAGNNQLVLLHCVSTYPPCDENINLNNLDLLRDFFPFPIGWSDHTIGCTISLAAAAKGACTIEKHFTLDKNLPGWDHKVSANPDDLKQIVVESKKVWRSLGSYQRVLPKEESDKRALFRRSIVVIKDMRKGEVISEGDLDFRRPGIGIEPKYASFIVGRVLKRDMKSEDLLKFEYLV